MPGRRHLRFWRRIIAALPPKPDLLPGLASDVWLWTIYQSLADLVQNQRRFPMRQENGFPLNVESNSHS